MRGQTAQQIARELLSTPDGTTLVLLAPILVNRKGEHRELLAEARRAGFVRLRVDGEILLSEETSRRSTNGANTPSRPWWIGWW